MATASAKAIPRIMFVWMVPVASGLRPIACTAPLVTIPMPAPAPMAPIMAKPAPISFAAMMISPVMSGSSVNEFGREFRRWDLNNPGFPARKLMSLFVRAVSLCRLRHEGHGEQAEHDRLDRAHEEFKHVKNGWHDGDRSEERTHHEQQHRSCKNISKKTEGKREDFRELRDEFEQANAPVYHTEYGLAEEGLHVPEFCEISHPLRP